MHEMTAANLRSAFGGESMAHMRYKVWGTYALEEGYPNVARLFRAISHAEQVHATNHFNQLCGTSGDFAVTSMAGFGVGHTADNLQGAIHGETFEIKEMYPAYLEVAKLQQEDGAQLSFHYSYSAEQIHAAMFAKAKRSVDAEQDVELGPVQICGVCGFTKEGDAPGRCPICNAAKDKFTSFE